MREERCVNSGIGNPWEAVTESNLPEPEAQEQPAGGVDHDAAESPGDWSIGAAALMLVLWVALQMGLSILFLPIVMLAHPRALLHMLERGLHDGRAVTSFLDILERAASSGVVIGPLLAVANVSFLALAYAVWVAPRRRPAREAIALVRSRFPRWIGMPVALGVGVLLDGVSLLTKQPIVPPKASMWFATPAGAVVMLVCLISIVPLTEEAYFRGVLYAAVSRRMGVRAAIAITALVFAVVHFSTYGVQWVVAFQAFVIGVTMGILRARAGSIWPCIVAHATFNLIASLEAAAGRLLAG